MLATGRCEDPLLLVTDDSVIAVGYRNLTINGTVVTFSCPPGLMLNGPKSVICTNTGQWEPAPSAVYCSDHEDVTTSSKKATKSYSVYSIAIKSVTLICYSIFI